jgi:hypothetical protein
LVVTALALAAAAAAGADEPRATVLDGFEDLTKVGISGGKVSAIRAGEGVTEGAQAAKVAPGATVSVTAPAGALASGGWLKIDALGADPVTYVLRIDLRGPGFRHAAFATLQPGKDTVVFPLTVATRRPADSPWPEGRVTVALTNQSPAATILDNVRVTPAAKPPEGAMLLDFGPDRQPLWPGFQPATVGDANVVWGGQEDIRAGSVGGPDPLTGDFVGPRLGYARREYLGLAAPGGKAAVAWLWVTHYAYRLTQPAEYGLMLRGKVEMQRRLGPQGLMSTEGLLEGMDGKWTPEWFDEVYSGHFAEMVKLSLPAGPQRLDLADCQLAALAMAPAAQQAAMTAYVARVLKDLSHYRRQFVVGRRHEHVCELSPTAEERRSGVIILQPPGGAGFSTQYIPDNDDRAETIRFRAVAGGRAIIPFAVVPLKQTAYLSAVLGALRSAHGRTLPTDVARNAVTFFESVPRVRWGRVEFQPWLLSARAQRVPARGIAYAAILLDVRESAPAGEYKGTLRVNFAGGSAEVPVAVQAADPLVAGGGGAATVAALDAARAEDLHRALAYLQAEPQRDLTTLRIRRGLMSDGLSALKLSAPSLSSELGMWTGYFDRELKHYPVRQARAPTLFDIGSARRRFDDLGVRPGTVTFRTALGKIVGAIKSAAAKLPSGACVYVGYCDEVEELRLASRVAQETRALGGLPAALISSDTISDAGADAAKLLSPFAMVVFVPDGKDLPSHLSAFRKARPEARAYICSWRADRYLTGFYARAVAADGAYVGGVTMTYGGPYTGFHLTGQALVVPQRGGGFASTLGLLRVRQGGEDYLLMKRCEQLLAKARAAKIDAKPLADILGEIRATARGHDGVHYDTNRLRTTAVAPGKLAAWRDSLIKAADEAAGKLTAHKSTR